MWPVRTVCFSLPRSVLFAMSRSVAGFALFLYVCVVSGQQSIRLKGTPTDPSIAIGVISGGNYPAGSFSIGHGDDNDNGDGRPGVDHGVDTGNVQYNPNYNGAVVYPNLPEQNGGKYVNGQNDIGGYGGQQNQNGANNYDVPLQNPGQTPINPYNDNYNRPSNTTPVKNSATRLSLFDRIFSLAFSWFY